MQTITLEATDKGPFKYYQMEIEIGSGVFGKVSLNGKKIYVMKGKAGQLSDNKAQDLIKNGSNEILLEISSIEENAGKSFFEENTVFIGLHGVNEKVFPSKETRIISIKWDFEEGQGKLLRRYKFELSR